MKRGAGPKRKTPMGRSSATLRAGAGLKRANLRPSRSRRERTPQAWKSGMPWGWEGHHIVSRQIVEREGGDIWDLRNRLPAPPLAHAQHTAGMARFPLALLPDSAYEFAVELLGAGRAYNLLRREYAGTDARLDALLLTPRQETDR